MSNVRLVERESQLAALRQYAAEASLGHGRLVLISGESGVGKSVLLEELSRGWGEARWLWGACDGLFTPAALGPLLDIARQLGGELLELCRAEARRDQLYGALLRQFGESGALTAAVIEDVHWADEATLDLLAYLGRRIQHLPVLLLVTYRDDAQVAGDPLQVTLGSLASQRATRRLGLAPLSTPGVAELAEGTGIDPAELHRLTGGNPFFVTEVIQANAEVLPASVRDAILARAAALSESARDALDVASLVGSRMRSDLLASLIDDPLIMDELIGRGLLIIDGDQLRFRHEVARVAVQGAIRPYRKAAIHAQILDVLLSERCDDDARLAFHAEGAGRADLVVWYGARAGRRASDLASHREAVAQYQRALASATDTDVHTRAALSDALAQELALVDRWEESAETRTAALALWREIGDAGRESQSMREFSKALWRLCRGPESVHAAEAALALAKPLGPSPELAWAYQRVAFHRKSNGRDLEGIALARQAREMAEQFGLSDVISETLKVEAQVVRAAGNDWTVPLGAALETALSGGHEEQAGLAFAVMYTMYSADLRNGEGEQCYRQALAYCEEHDIGTFGACLQAERTSVLERIGRWNECVSLANALLHQHTLSPWNRLKPLCSVAKVMARRGQQGFWPYLDEAMESAMRLGEPEWILPAGMARVEAYWLEGQLNAAISELGQIRDVSASVPPIERGWLALWSRRLIGSAVAMDVEPFASQVAGDGAHAAELWDRLGYRYEAALALLDTKEEALLRASLARLSDLGADAAANLVRRTMRDLGIRSIPVGVRTGTRAHPSGLTAREQEILHLLSQGESNEEIAGRLFISVRTVEHHVSAILGKLGASSRKAAAREARRLGLTGSQILSVPMKST
jgi:DNA-binding CsgD family transcriptional regulator